MSAPCIASLTLTLQPGEHFPGAQPGSLPSDLPPGDIVIHVPLYPETAPTAEQESLPAFSVPSAGGYLKSASVTYRSSATVDSLTSWYDQAFRACGFRSTGTGSASNGRGAMSEEIDFGRTDGANGLSVMLSFEASSDGATLILYVAVEVTPPAYPVPGSVLRVPGTPVALTITQYRGMNPGPHGPQPVRTVSIDDAKTAASLADEINHLPKVFGVYHCPMDDSSHLTLAFRGADQSMHAVYIGLRGCQNVMAPPAPAGRLIDDPNLLPRIIALLRSPGSRSVPYPYEASTLRPIAVRRLGAISSRFLATGQNGSHLLYLSRGHLFMSSPVGRGTRLLARGIADATFAINDTVVLARRKGSDLSHLILIDTRRGAVTPFHLPKGASLLGRNAGTRAPGLSDAMTCDLQYIFFRIGASVGAINPEQPAGDRFRSPPLLPRPSRTSLTAISCSGFDVADFRPGRGLAIYNTASGDFAEVTRRVRARGVTFLSWAPDDIHLAYRTGGRMYVLDVQTGKIHPLLDVGSNRIEGAAWDPWSHVLALALTPRHQPVTASRVIVTDISGRAGRVLRLRFSGATRLEWSRWTGQTIGVTQLTSRGSLAWAVSLPAPPPDPGMALLGQ